MAQARRHRVTAVAHEQIAAFAQRGGQIKTRDAAARTAPFAALAAENDGGPVKLLEHARRDDADDADVPEQLSLDDDEIRLRIKLCLNAPMTSSTMPRSIFCRSRFRESRFCASGIAPAKSRASNKCSDSSAVSSRPAAFRRGAELKPDFVSAEFGGHCATCLSATRPGRCVVLSRCKPAETRIRFSPVNGTRSAIVPSATRSSSGRKSNSAAPGRPISRPRLTSACASLKARPAEQSSVKVGVPPSAGIFPIRTA